MKPALYYAIRNSWTNDIVAITSEKGGYRKHWYGRTVDDNMSTHGHVDDIKGRFDTLEAAQSKRDEIKAIVSRYRELRAAHHQAITQLHHGEREAIDMAVGNV